MGRGLSVFGAFGFYLVGVCWLAKNWVPGLETWECFISGPPETSLVASEAKDDSLKALSVISMKFKLKKSD